MNTVIRWTRATDAGGGNGIIGDYPILPQGVRASWLSASQAARSPRLGCQHLPPDRCDDWASHNSVEVDARRAFSRI